MRIVNVHAAKTHLSRLLEDAAAGEEIVIAKAGKPVAKLVALTSAKPGKRQLGILGRKIRAHDDFDAPLPPEMLDAFEGR